MIWPEMGGQRRRESAGILCLSLGRVANERGKDLISLKKLRVLLVFDKSYKYKMLAKFNLRSKDSYNYIRYSLEALGHMGPGCGLQTVWSQHGW